MSESEDIELVVHALKKVPAKNLHLIEMANTVAIKNGELDYDELGRRQPEINLAIAEAKMYGAYTIQAVDALKRIKGRADDV